MIGSTLGDGVLGNYVIASASAISKAIDAEHRGSSRPTRRSDVASVRKLPQ
jgi:hypothetical protein